MPGALARRGSVATSSPGWGYRYLANLMAQGWFRAAPKRR